jgi:hypothetical protein
MYHFTLPSHEHFAFYRCGSLGDRMDRRSDKQCHHDEIFPEASTYDGSSNAPPLLRKSIASDFRRLHFVFMRGYADSPDSAFVTRMDIHRRVSLLSGVILAFGLVIGAVYTFV